MVAQKPQTQTKKKTQITIERNGSKQEKRVGTEL